MITPPDISWLGILPEIILGLGAALILLIDVQWKPQPKILCLTAGGILGLAGIAAVIQQLWLGGLGAEEQTAANLTPFSGMLVIDRYGIFAHLLLTVVALCGLGGGWRFFESLGRRGAEGLALLLLATAGFGLMASTPHLVMMFLGLEIGSISLYVLAGFTRTETASEEAAIKYFLLGSFASAIFIYGVALLFAGTGSLNLFDQRAFLAANIVLRPAVLLIGLALTIVGLAFKVTAAPFHTWAPDVYQGAPAGVVGFMAAAAKVGGFAALVRLLSTGFVDFSSSWALVVAAIAALSMVIGSFLGVVQDDVRRLLAYSGVAHAGFILTGVVAGRAGTGGVWFYLAVYAVQLVGAYAVVAAVSGPSSAGSAMARYAGLGRRQPFLALGLTVLLLGMAGIPLTSGFIAKFGVFQEAWRAGFGWLVVVALLASVVSFFIYLRVIVAMYMGEADEDLVLSSKLSSAGQASDGIAGNHPGVGLGTPLRAVLTVAIAVTLIFGLLPAPLLRLAADALPL